MQGFNIVYKIVLKFKKYMKMTINSSLNGNIN